ncbi:Ig-like domain-containing protein [Clostridium oryzae]|uniref:Beta-N-acetylglucosaminidase n=1 Tax=Clostridium oryzae TaxID=1450648 RepID=A0A1V4IDG3_9CLOT|nr:Ig-like domain-containing protein [Clostridium oryzae]OPJ57976.1 beta-N-acetylglucosaminidase precursor [Clostridium oryzae]
MKKWKSTLLLTLTLSFGSAANTVNVQAVSLPPRMALDTVKNYMSVDGSKLDIKGWAINSTGINKIKVFINDNYFSRAAYGALRTDVRKAYPTYKNSGNSGYLYSLKLNNYSPSTYKLTVKAIGNDNKISSITRYIKIVSSIKYRLESITENMNITKNSVAVKGWAISRYGIKSVKILVDDKFIGYASYGLTRSDVKNTYTEYINADKSGYNYALNLDNLVNGKHKITVQIIDNRNTSKIINRYVNILEKSSSDWGKIFLESRKTDINSDSIYVKGWFISKTGLENVNIYLDNELEGTADSGLIRNDVAAAYPEYPQQYASQSGFSYNIDINNIAPGRHVLKIIGTDRTGRTLYLIRTINIIKKASKLCIDAPKNNSILDNKPIDIKGWALNASGVSKVQVSVDGNYVGDASIGISRPDVDLKYSGYRFGSSSGYLYSLDTSKISPGLHSITVKAIGYDGTSYSKTLSINMYGHVSYRNYPTTLDNFVNMQFNKGGNVTFSRHSSPASKEQIAYYMNPENFINSVSGKYMFLKLSYNEGITVKDLNTVLRGKGILEGMGQAYLDAGIANNVNPVYLVAHSLLETGNGTSALSNGSITVNGQSIYNVYGIGAFDSDPDGAGSKSAYSQQWFSVEEAIKGGAKFISSYYINNKYTPQDTLYEMRWNYDNIYHQYATDISWANKQVYNIKKLVDMMQNSSFYYEIPIYK